MAAPAFDLETIVLVTILDTIIDLVAFKLFGVKGVTVLVTIFLDFLFPYIGFLAFASLHSSLEQQITAMTDFITNITYNLVNYIISAVIAYLITALIFIFSGGTTERPEF